MTINPPLITYTQIPQLYYKPQQN